MSGRLSSDWRTERPAQSSGRLSGRNPCFFSRLAACVRGAIPKHREFMRRSRYFLPILRETPKEAEIASHRLMLRAGMMRQEAAGIYAFLPLGFRALQKICAIVREE